MWALGPGEGVADSHDWLLEVLYPLVRNFYRVLTTATSSGMTPCLGITRHDTEQQWQFSGKTTKPDDFESTFQPKSFGITPWLTWVQ